MRTQTITITGQIQHVDLEGGYFVIATSDRKTYKLEGIPAELKHPQLRVEIEGTLEPGSFGIGFGTPVLHIQKYKIRP